MIAVLSQIPFLILYFIIQFLLLISGIKRLCSIVIFTVFYHVFNNIQKLYIYQGSSHLAVKFFLSQSGYYQALWEEAGDKQWDKDQSQQLRGVSWEESLTRKEKLADSIFFVQLMKISQEVKPSNSLEDVIKTHFRLIQSSNNISYVFSLPFTAGSFSPP